MKRFADGSILREGPDDDDDDDDDYDGRGGERSERKKEKNLTPKHTHRLSFLLKDRHFS